MNVSQVKGIIWILSVALTGGLFWYVYSFFNDLDARRQRFDEPAALELLTRESTSEGPKVDVVALADVQRTFIQLNWTGKETQREVVQEAQATPLEAPKTPVADLIQIHFIQEDLERPESSEAFISYRDAAKVQIPSKTPLFLRPGDRLAAPHTGVRVESIDAKGVTFVFDEEGRAAETVLAPRYDVERHIVQVGPEGPVLPPKTAFRAFEGRRPLENRQTQLVGKDRYALGTEDLFLFADDYPTIIAREVRHRRHRDPKTGKYDGIELQDVQSGGTVARHGGQAGDVIKSINGHTVTSVSEAITFVKNNKDKYSVWEVVVENKGQERTVIYESPSTQP